MENEPPHFDVDRSRGWPSLEEMGQACQRVREETAAQQEPVVAPYKIRVFLNDMQGTYFDIGVTTLWPLWLQQLPAFGGIAHEKGYIPLHAIKLIVHLDDAGKEVLPRGDNVVPFGKKP